MVESLKENHRVCIVCSPVELVQIHMSSYRNSCKCNDTLVVVVGNGLVKVGGFHFEDRSFFIKG